ncbi:MAG: hypothetical protein DME61_01105 [Verrucomicrobia bacterium]|nr:MAG: hypothetical protein DME61_01105 [Verrucomicrobiota bacterium]
MKWIPAWGENRIAGTVESRPDWVISRQRSWGVPLPVFYSKDGKAILDAKIIRKLADLVAERGSNIWFGLNDADLAKRLGLPPGTTKRNDTIDVWIDSGVSHKAVCALHPELRDPADMYLEATEVSLSILTAKRFRNRERTRSQQPPITSLAGTARICCGFGPAASITPLMSHFLRKCLPVWATPIGGSETRCAFCWAIFMTSNQETRKPGKT